MFYMAEWRIHSADRSRRKSLPKETGTAQHISLSERALTDAAAATGLDTKKKMLSIELKQAYRAWKSIMGRRKSAKAHSPCLDNKPNAKTFYTHGNQNKKRNLPARPKGTKTRRCGIERPEGNRGTTIQDHADRQLPPDQIGKAGIVPSLTPAFSLGLVLCPLGIS